MEKPFVPFGLDQFVAIALAFAVPLFLGVVARTSGSRRIARAFSLALAAELIATWALWYWLIAARGWLSVENILPMQLCDWAAIASIVALLRPSQRSFEVAYFWAFSGSLQALLTPELFYGFPDLRFIVFFAFHDGAIATPLYLMLAFKLRPVPASLPRVIAWSFFYLLCALTANMIFHTNFGYLSAKPAKPSLLDVMGPWPIYVVACVALGLAFVVLLYTPFYVADLLRTARIRRARDKNACSFHARPVRSGRNVHRHRN